MNFTQLLYEAEDKERTIDRSYWGLKISQIGITSEAQHNKIIWIKPPASFLSQKHLFILLKVKCQSEVKTRQSSYWATRGLCWCIKCQSIWLNRSTSRTSHTNHTVYDCNEFHHNQWLFTIMYYITVCVWVTHWHQSRPKQCIIL